MLVAFCSFTFALGAATVGGFSLLFHPELVERFDGAPLWLGQAGAAALIAAPSLYVIGSLLHFPPLKIGAFELVYPRPPIAARQLLAGPLELIGASGIIYFALPAAANPGFAVVLGVFRRLVLDRAGQPRARRPRRARVHLSRRRCRTRRRPMSSRRSLVFRLLYLILPLIFALGRRLGLRAQALARARRRQEEPVADALGDLDQ